MLRYILQKLFFSILTIWCVATLTFILMHNLPGDPFTSKKVSTQISNNLKIKYELDKPLHQQYLSYMINLLKGDLGVSMVYVNRSVNSIIARTFPVSADLGIRALIISSLIGVFLGIIAALYRKRFLDYATSSFALLGVSIPIFIFAILIQYFLCFKLSNFIKGLTGLDYNILPITGWEGFRYTIAPSIALSFCSIGIFIRMMRTSVLDTLRQDYVTTAKAKGLNNKEILLKHVIKNASLPIVSLMGPMITATVTGSFIIENIFMIPGMGRYFIESIQSKDYTMIMGLSLFTVTILVGANILVDIFCVLIDPRIRLINVRD